MELKATIIRHLLLVPILALLELVFPPLFCDRGDVHGGHGDRDCRAYGHISLCLRAPSSHLVVSLRFIFLFLFHLFCS